ncbi:MAG: hypothetical protein IKA67_00725, partial [Clostridia bacterium]|nr:hypothetical protein [Clostridia bacterium]
MTNGKYTFSNGKNEILRLCRDKAYGDALSRALSEAKYAREHFADRAEWISGWAHNFCCPECASQMTFDSDMAYGETN